jgi:flagellar hook-length control protein FliK
VENADQAAAITAAVPHPALSAFDAASPRPPSPADAKPSKRADRSEPLAETQMAEPEGILPPADKPDAAAALAHKGNGAPTLQHRSPTELLKPFSESRPSTPDQPSGQTTFSDNSSTATLATGSHATIVSGAAATTFGQNQLQPQQAVPLSGVPVLIASRALAGDKHIDIRLDPPELGRIEVRLKVDREGQISSHLIADRPDTLALLRRDGAGLERALQDAGFKTAGDGLQFSLRDQSGNGQPDARTAPQPLAADQDTNTRLDTVPNSYMRYSGRVGGLDIRV